MTVEEFTAHLEAVRTVSRGYLAKCPSHADRHPSLSIKEGDRGVLVKCWAGCTLEEICAALGLHVRDLFFDATPDPLALHRTQVQRSQAARAQYLAGLQADTIREARRFLLDARADINQWSDKDLDNAWQLIGQAHAVLQPEEDYYEFCGELCGIPGEQYAA